MSPKVKKGVSKTRSPDHSCPACGIFPRPVVVAVVAAAAAVVVASAAAAAAAAAATAVVVVVVVVVVELRTSRFGEVFRRFRPLEAVFGPRDLEASIRDEELRRGDPGRV